MFFCPYAHRTFNSRKLNLTSTVRLLHAAPNAPNIDIYVNDKLFIGNLSYSEFTKYMTVPSGNYNVKIYPVNETVKPLIITDVNLEPNYVFTGAVIGTLPDLSLLPIPDPANPNTFGTACIRFVHLSPNAPAVDVTLQDGTMLFKNVKYKDYTLYVCVPQETYTFQVKVSGTDQAALTVSNVQLIAGNYYSIYAVGLLDKNPALEALLSTDYNSSTQV